MRPCASHALPPARKQREDQLLSFVPLTVSNQKGGQIQQRKTLTARSCWSARAFRVELSGRTRGRMVVDVPGFKQASACWAIKSINGCGMIVTSAKPAPPPPNFTPTGTFQHHPLFAPPPHVTVSPMFRFFVFQCTTGCRQWELALESSCQHACVSIRTDFCFGSSSLTHSLTSNDLCLRSPSERQRPGAAGGPRMVLHCGLQ